jgi:hypothetical protein
MFKSFDELIRFKRSQFHVWRESLVRWISGIVLAGAGFQAVYSLMAL